MSDTGATPRATTRVDGTRFGDIRWFDGIDSTNTYLAAQARAGAPEGLVAVADHQSAGRGRLGRSWVAPPGASLLMSVLLRPALPAELLALAGTAVALAAAEAAAGLAGVKADLKWPNDLLVDGRKLAGILSEAEFSGGRPAVVVGLGMNVNWPEPLPDEVAATATSLDRLCGHRVPVADLAVAVLEALEGRRRQLDDPEGRAALAVDYRRSCCTVGQRVRVELPNRAVTGTAVDVTAEGRLVLDADGTRMEVSVGDVVHLRPVSA
ncbi:MAG TPA: biotin--[acetyl-CoA-carboxylase] ligase [Acidimicrobiales bacterium]|nr:biotin--[acetyl-CoA-carboxylase] ligase [Acidimicrobiales bacterium]